MALGNLKKEKEELFDEKKTSTISCHSALKDVYIHRKKGEKIQSKFIFLHL